MLIPDSRRVRLKQRARPFNAHRLAEYEPLRIFAAELKQFDGIGIGFGALGYRVMPRSCAKAIIERRITGRVPLADMRTKD